MPYDHIVHAVFAEPWAILPSTYAAMCEVVRLRADGTRLTAAEVAERIGAAPVRAGAARNGAVAILPLYGVLAQRMNMMTQVSGGTSTEMFGKAFREAAQDPAVSAIVLDIDSPGGSVFGIDELAAEIRAARGSRPIVAVADSLAASAAYWIAAQADEVVVTPGGLVGSIGVLSAHEDISKQEEMEGIKTTIISAGKYKAESSPFAPLSDEARAAEQAMVDKYYGMFIAAVAKGRGVQPSAVSGGFGQGRVVKAEDAVGMGMADRIATLDQTIARLLGRKSAETSQRAEVDVRQRRLRVAGW